MSASKNTNADNSAAQPPQTLDAVIRELITDLNNHMQFFMSIENIQSNLTGKDRNRLFSAGVRN